MISRSTDIKAALRSRQRGFFMSPYRFSQSPAGDPYFANVSLLIHGDAGIVDLSGSPKTISQFGSVSVSDGSILFGGGHLELANNSAFALGQSGQPFSIELDVLTTSLSDIAGILTYANGSATNANYAYALYRINSGVQLNAFQGETSSASGSIGVLPLGTFTRIELSYDGTTFREFIGGVLVRSSSPGLTTINNPVGATLKIGRNNTIYPAWSGRMKNIRITKGVARNVSAYTPSSGFFPTS